jgi:hypothetical protein
MIKKLYDKGFHLISDLLDKDGKFLKLEQIDNEHLVTIPFTLYEGLKRAILKSWPNVRHLTFNEALKPHRSNVIRILVQDKKGSRTIYNYFNNTTEYKPLCEMKWEMDLDFSPTFTWQKVYKNIMFTTKDTGLMWFAYRIVHRIIGTNNYLFKIKVLDNKACSICSQDPETITHLFFHCPFVARIWTCLSSWILQKTGTRVQFDLQSVLFGLLSDCDKIINLIIILVKRCIFSFSRKKSPFTFNDVTAYICNHIIIMKRKYLALKSF